MKLKSSIDVLNMILNLLSVSELIQMGFLGELVLGLY